MHNKSFRKRYILQISLIALALSFIAVGIIRGDAVAVFRKAVFICMECIGIG